MDDTRKRIDVWIDEQDGLISTLPLRIYLEQMFQVKVIPFEDVPNFTCDLIIVYGSFLDRYTDVLLVLDHYHAKVLWLAVGEKETFVKNKRLSVLDAGTKKEDVGELVCKLI